MSTNRLNKKRIHTNTQHSRTLARMVCRIFRLISCLSFMLYEMPLPKNSQFYITRKVHFINIHIIIIIIITDVTWIRWHGIRLGQTTEIFLLCCDCVLFSFSAFFFILISYFLTIFERKNLIEYLRMRVRVYTLFMKFNAINLLMF